MQETMNALEQRIVRLEQHFGSVPGTSLSRTLAPTSGMQWTLALGPLQAPKVFFNGPTIEAAVQAAERAIFGGKEGCDGQKAQPSTTYEERLELVKMAKAGDVWRNIKTKRNVKITGRKGFDLHLEHELGRKTTKQDHYFASDYEPIPV